MSIPRRHRRRLCLLLTLSAGTMSLLILSAWYSIGVKFWSGAVGVVDGRLVATWRAELAPDGPPGPYMTRRLGDPTTFTPPGPHLSFFAFEFYPRWLIVVPFWPIPLTLAALALTLPLRHKRRTRRGLCPNCDYDLSAMDHPACPECGHQPVPHPPTLPSL